MTMLYEGNPFIHGWMKYVVIESKCFQVLKLTRQEALHSTGLEQIWFGSFSSLKVCSSEHEEI
jgi:hypothetical protein